MGGAEGPGARQWAAAGAGRGVGSGQRPHAAARAAAASARAAGAAPLLRSPPRSAVTAVMSGLARKLARGAAPGAAVPGGSRPAPRPPLLGTAPAPSGSARVRSLRFKKPEIAHKVPSKALFECSSKNREGGWERGEAPPVAPLEQVPVPPSLRHGHRRDRLLPCRTESVPSPVRKRINATQSGGLPLYLSQAQNLKRNNLVMKLNSVMHGVTQ